MPTKPKTIDQLKREARGFKSARQEHDATRRDPQVRRVYQSRRWQAVRSLKLERHPICERCAGQGRATYVNLQIHHIKKVKDHPELAFDLDNLMTLCPGCHATVEREGAQRGGGR